MRWKQLFMKDLKEWWAVMLPRSNFFPDYVQSSETMGPVIASDIKTKAIWAVGISLVLMFLYIFIRFRNWQYGVGPLLSLAHDTVDRIGIYSLFWGILPFSMEIDQSFIAAILTVIGYSVNDSVVVFDRVREFLPLHRKRPAKDVLNLALNDTLSRTTQYRYDNHPGADRNVLLWRCNNQGIPLCTDRWYRCWYLFIDLRCNISCL